MPVAVEQFSDGVGNGGNGLRDVLNQLIDVSRSTIGLTGKAGNLLGNNGKTASGFTGACCLNTGIER